MPVCPICGKDSVVGKIEINGKNLVNPCNLCKSYAICLMKPVSPNAKENARDWAKKVVSTHQNPYVRDITAQFLNYSYSPAATDGENDVKPSVAKTQTAGPASYAAPTCSAPSAADYSQGGYSAGMGSVPYTPSGPGISTRYTKIVKTILILVDISIILAAIIGGAVAGEFLGAIIGFLAGAIAAVASTSFVMMFVEISENIAVNAQSSLRSEAILQQIAENQKKNISNK